MLSALTRAFLALLHPKMLLLMIWPLAIALLLWLGLAYAFWSEAVQWIDLQFKSTDTVQWMLTVWPLALVATHLAWIVLVMVSVPLVLVVAVVIISVFAMPFMVKHVSARDFPGLVPRRGGSFTGSVWNAGQALAVFLILVVVTLPLWLVPLVWPVLPVLLLAYVNQRMFRYDALAEHASAEELEQIIRDYRGEFFALGVVIAIAGHIPVFGFLVPVFGGLVFIYFCFSRLQALRDARVAGTARAISE